MLVLKWGVAWHSVGALMSSGGGKRTQKPWSAHYQVICDHTTTVRHVLHTQVVCACSKWEPASRQFPQRGVISQTAEYRNMSIIDHLWQPQSDCVTIAMAANVNIHCLSLTFVMWLLHSTLRLLGHREWRSLVQTFLQSFFTLQKKCSR